MAWNEPDKDKDPWGERERAPELDDIVRNLQNRFRSVFGGGGGGGSGSGGDGSLGPTLGILAVVVAVGWAFAGLYTVDASSVGVLQRFGAYQGTTEPGLRWRPWGVDRVTIVDVQGVQEFNHESMMLTGDANIIDASINVQYRRSDPVKWVFNVRDPDESLREVSEAAIREVAGRYAMETIQTVDRNKVAQETLAAVQRILDKYDVGIDVLTVNLNSTEFPQPVREAVQDVIRASRDQERYILQAEAYANKILPNARGDADRALQEAEGYRDRLIADASGEAERFKKLLAEYSQAPAVTRERLYLETIEEVYGSSSKVLMGSQGTGNLMYLPIDKLLERSGKPMVQDERDAAAPVDATPSTQPQSRADARARSRSRD